ncbi:hypothetical protein FNB15_14445 [Ferrovibrio terrae]|uniref:DUF1468 domain-containing protein n=1 Tax=Ferrovibrio terrae TaxID=2594003 RepID=A0A516H3Q6_9PROT|nr:tripartite tricarboxylate transporter TctB family protein [Ferrovibrio terrae]QDO98399.1 hypothetical protein FNB15_14445 [Ferrovibrio terrae]
MAQQQLSTDVITGGLLLLAGGGLLALTWQYPSGTLSDIGPGMILQLAGTSLAVLGVLMLLRGWRQITPQRVETIPRRLVLRPFVVPAAMAAFGLLLPWLGLALTAAFTAFAASFGSAGLRLRERLITAFALAAFVTLLFGYGLRLPVSVWPGFAA